MDVRRGEVVVLLGPSGAGKTSFLRTINLLNSFESGEMFVDGHRMGYKKTKAGAYMRDNHHLAEQRRNIGFVFQHFNLFPHMTALENVWHTPVRIMKRPKAQCVEEAKKLLQQVELSEKIDLHPRELSGGQQQRVALARALAPKPAILLMDEPFSNLDQGLRERVRRETVEILKSLDTTAIIVTHDPQEAMAVGDQVVLMRQGRVEQTGSPYDIYDRPVSSYAAEFMGPCNRLTGIWAKGHIETPIGNFPADLHLPEGALAVACIRPQTLAVMRDGEGITARILAKSFLGESEQMDISVHPLAQPLRIHSHTRSAMAVGEQVKLNLNGAQVHVFAETDTPRLPKKLD